MSKKRRPNPVAPLHPIEKWAHDIVLGVGGLRDFERHEMAMPRYDRDVCIVLWAIRCLTNPTSDLAGEVLDAIEHERERRHMRALEVKP